VSRVTLKVIAAETGVCCERAELFWDCSLAKSKGTSGEFVRKYLSGTERWWLLQVFTLTVALV